jgi:hypothetical protein
MHRLQWDDSYTVAEDGSVLLDPLALTVMLTAMTLPESINGTASDTRNATDDLGDNGTVDIDAAGAITFNPDADFNGV